MPLPTHGHFVNVCTVNIDSEQDSGIKSVDLDIYAASLKSESLGVMDIGLGFCRANT